MDELVLLQAVRLKGRAQPPALAAATTASVSDVERALRNLIASGICEQTGTGFRLTGAGRSRLDELLEKERSALDGERADGLYAAFLELNGAMKQLVTDWQLRDGITLNDHGDAAYDRAVVRRLASLHASVTRLTADLAAFLPRLRAYGERLDTALRRVREGEGDYLAKPLLDSYHTVWFELHEVLIDLTGRTRASEAAAGRAE